MKYIYIYINFIAIIDAALFSIKKGLFKIIDIIYSNYSIFKIIQNKRILINFDDFWICYRNQYFEQLFLLHVNFNF